MCLVTTSPLLVGFGVAFGSCFSGLAACRYGSLTIWGVFAAFSRPCGQGSVLAASQPTAVETSTAVAPNEQAASLVVWENGGYVGTVGVGVRP